MPNTAYITGKIYPFYKKGTKEQVIDSDKRKKWHIVLSLPPGPSGERRRKYYTFYGKKKEAEQEKDRLVNEFNKNAEKEIYGDVILEDASDITFGEYVERFLKERESITRRNTWEFYVGVAKNHIIPNLGKIPLDKISAQHISRYKKKMLMTGRKDGKKGGLDPTTVNKHLSLISIVLEDAASLENRLIEYNPAMMVKRAKAKDGKKIRSPIVNCLSVEELKKLLAKLEELYLLYKEQVAYSLRWSTGRSEFKSQESVALKLKQLGYTGNEIVSPRALYKFKASKLYPIVYLTARTGMRLSEVLALKWSDINFKEQIIRVYSSSHYGTRKEDEETSHFLSSTKEGKPKSYIHISSKDVEFLKQHRKDQLEQRMRYRGKYHDNNLVFCKNDGTYLRNDSVSKAFSEFAKTNGFNITFHGLRHSHCTHLLAAGVSNMEVARRLGHQDPATSERFYSHVEKGNSINLGEFYNDILEGKKTFSKEAQARAEKEAIQLI